jgi:hypothetical protein
LGFGFCSKITERKPVSVNRFRFGFGFLNSLVIFLDKNQTEPKIITSNHAKLQGSFNDLPKKKLKDAKHKSSLL